MPAKKDINRITVEEINNIVDRSKEMPIRAVLCYVAWDSFKPATCFNMLQLTGSQIFCLTLATCGSLLPFTRNNIINELYKIRPDFTHAMFVDADMGEVTIQCVDDMLSADKPIISPIMTQRYPPFLPCIQYADYPRLVDQMHKEPDKREVIEVGTTGLGCMLVKREVLDAIGEPMPDGDRMWFAVERQLRQSFPDECNKKYEELAEKQWADGDDPVKEAFKIGVQFGLTATVGAAYFGEDYSFCMRARKNGFKIFLDTRHAITHVGDVQYGIEDWAITTQGKDVESRLERHTKVFYERGSDKIFGHKCPRPSPIYILDNQGNAIHKT